jgi:hypothetical protein
MTAILPIMWVIGPSVRPADLAVRLVEHGLTFSHKISALVLNLNTANIDAPSVDGLVIKEVRDGEELLPGKRV